MSCGSGDGHADRCGGAGHATVVGDQLGQAVAEGASCREMNRVEATHDVDSVQCRRGIEQHVVEA